MVRGGADLFVDEVICRIAFSLVHIEEDSKKSKGINEAFAILSGRKASQKDQSVVPKVTLALEHIDLPQFSNSFLYIAFTYYK